MSSVRLPWAHRSLMFLALLCLPTSHVYAEISVLGRGFLLDSGGSLTSAPGETISGKNSIKGSYSGQNSFTPFLITDATFIQFAPSQTYTITLTYRIITAGSRGFEMGFFSDLGSRAGRYVQSATITGSAGTSGTATLTARLENFTDYGAGLKVVGTGAIVVDDIRITNASGQLVASENAEGPTLVRGPLNFQLTDAMTLFTESRAFVRSAAAKDLDEDGYPETILTLSTDQGLTAFPPLVIEARAQMRRATAQFFPAGAPTVKHSPLTFVADVNHDGLRDILFAEAGSDVPPWPGSVIGVALNQGNGTYEDVSRLVPEEVQRGRSYALAAGDLDGDGRVEIVLPDQNQGRATALLRWNGDGFDADRNWIAASLWRSPTNLMQQSWMSVDDLDGDGRQDLIVFGQQHSPNTRILFGAREGWTAANLVQLPDGPFGHAPFSPSSVVQGADTGPNVIADFNNDGLLDIFVLEEQVLTYPPGMYTDTNDMNYEGIRANGGTVYAEMSFQVFVNRGSRNFIDVTAGSSVQRLGRRHYRALMPFDMNNDGFMDLVGQYLTKVYARAKMQWGTTLFLNDGTGAFQVVDGARLLAAVTTTPSNGQQWNLGSFVPTLVNRGRTEGVVFEPVGQCGGPGFCPAVAGLNLYKIVANAAIGTGPDFADSTSSGVPGFNEFYYIRHCPGAATAVQRDEYRNGLAHYVTVGMVAGCTPHAPNARPQRR